jgi:hypothetical protein
MTSQKSEDLITPWQNPEITHTVYTFCETIWHGNLILNLTLTGSLLLSVVWGVMFWSRSEYNSLNLEKYI